jgi:hypothetical protein
MVHQTTCNNFLDDKEQDLRIKAHCDDNIVLKKTRFRIKERKQFYDIRPVSLDQLSHIEIAVTAALCQFCFII